jgi:hypothetical protein
MTLALTERLDIEVEPLDSLFGIDADHLPSDDFRDRVGGLRLAWAVAADWNAPINFLRERRRRLAKTVLTRAAIVAGVATGLGIAWRIQRTALLEPSKPAAKPVVAAPVIVPPRVRPAPIPPPPSPVAAAPSSTPIRVPPSAPAPQPRASVPAPTPTPAQVDARPPAVVPLSQPAVQPPVRPTVTTTARVPTSPPVVLAPVPEPPQPASPREPQTSPVSAAAVPPPARRPPAEEVPLPFEGTLGTILYGADRKLAIIDGRIVQVGDDVRGGRVVEITPNSVLFRDRQGRLRQLTLEGPGR